MPRDTYVPKHRSAPQRRVRKSANRVVKISGLAVWATGLTVAGGVVVHGQVGTDAAVKFAAGHAVVGTDNAASRQLQTSRSSGDRRVEAANLKAGVLDDSKGFAVTKTEDLSVADPKTLARALMPQYGLSSSEFDCLNNIWTQESNWNVHADNPHSSAYGIPQALPGSKMSTAGPDWAHSAETQIRWGLGYIQKRYGSACSAWSFKRGHGWY